MVFPGRFLYVEGRSEGRCYEEIRYIEKLVEVPHVVYEERIVEVPQVERRELIRHVPVSQVQVVDKKVGFRSVWV